MTSPTNHTISAVLLDVDGTLVNSNDAHANAWVTAFAEAGIDVPFAQVRRLIRMGGEKLMPEVSDLTEDSPQGKRIAQRRGEIFVEDHLPAIKPFRDADKLVAALKDRGFTVVAASSARKDELRPLLERARARWLLDDETSSDDAEASKPEPDIIEAALKRAKASADQTIMIGDTPYDIEAARRAGVPTIAFRSGGWDDADLVGAIAIYDGPWDLLAQLDRSPLGRSALTARALQIPQRGDGCCGRVPNRMIHERQVISASLWDLRAHHEEELRTLGVAQRAVDAWRATPTAEQRMESLAVLQTQLERFARSNAMAAQLLADLRRLVNEKKT